MTPREELEADLIRLVQEHPLFPLMVTYGLELLLRHAKSIPDNYLRIWFDGRYAPDSIRYDLQTIIDLLCPKTGHNSTPVS